MTRNAANRVTKKVDGRSIESNYAYDWMGRLTGVTYPANPVEDVSYIYDYNYYDNYENGQLTYLQDNDGYMVFARDPVGNILARADWLTSASSYAEYTYDNLNRVSQVLYPSGRIVLYTRNALGQITEIKTQDDASSPVYTLASEITYVPYGPVKKIKFGSGLVTTFTRDAENRPTRILTLSTPIWVRDYTYDAAGNVTAIADPFGTQDRTFGYDVLDWLTSNTHPLSTDTFHYDANGNRTGGTIAGTPFTAGYGASSNRQTDLISLPVTTDGAGNVTSNPTSGSYTYNYANRMSQSFDGTVTTGYLYNGFGQRTTKENGDKIHYDYLLDGRYADAIKINPNGSYAEVTEYIWLDNMPIAQVKTNYATGGAVSSRVLTYIHVDHLNTPRSMTDTSKKMVWRWERDAFNMVYPEDDPDGNGVAHRLDLGFPGQIRDVETSLFYNMNRYYDPVMGR